VKTRVPWLLDAGREHRLLVRARLTNLVPVREPLVLVTQVQRSGGTLLTQLLDGHPECHVHAPDLQIGDAARQRWPELDLTESGTWFSNMFEAATGKRLRHGYTKSGRMRLDGDDVFPFLFLPRLQKTIFDACVSEREIEFERDVFDCYWTSYFNAWLDNHNLYTGPKKIVAGFKPRVAFDEQAVDRFFRVYPDGRLISIVREPRTWYASARAHSRKYENVDAAIDLWRQSAESSLAVRERFGERVLLLTFDELVRFPEATMTFVAEGIGISMSPTLLTPTFNGRPIRANSSSPVSGYGVLRERAHEALETLEPETGETVLALAGDLYARATEAASIGRSGAALS
jgi:sulfotransferase family protein